MNLIYHIYFLINLTTYLFSVDAILGGDVAEKGQFPYQAALFKENVICSGAILDNWHVVTAAYCLIDDHHNPRNLFVAVSVTNIFSKTTIFNIDKLFVPKSYLELEDSDIAVVKLRSPLNFVEHDPKFDVVELPVNDTENYDDLEATVSGYGENKFEINIDNEGNEEYSTIIDGSLRYLTTKVIPATLCVGSSRQEFCAQARQRQNLNTPEGICESDIGGPLVIRGTRKLIGIAVANAVSCNESKSPALYTRVSSHLDFIHKALKDEEDKNIHKYKLW